MAARAMWKGCIRFGEVHIPVKLYAAAEDRSVHFRLLHAKDQVPVRQQLLDPETDTVVESDQVQRGFEVEPGVFVVLRPEEIEQLTPPSSRDIEVTHFVPDHQVGHAWLDRPYYFGPDGNEADYFALAELLRTRRRVGIVHWTMRKKAYVGSLRARGPYLALMTLRRAEDVVELPALKPLEAPSSRRRTKDAQADREAREAKLAEQLISALAGHFDPEAYHDDYRERLVHLLEAKAQGEPAPLRKPIKKAPVRPMSDVLQESLQRVKERRSA